MPDRCCLAGVDFLGAMEVDLREQICKNNKKKNERGRRKDSKKACGGKMNSRVGIYTAQNIRHFSMAKGSTQQRRVSTQQRRDLRCFVPEGWKKATQWRKALRHCGPERYTSKMLCFLCSSVEFYATAYQKLYAAAYQKVWTRGF